MGSLIVYGTQRYLGIRYIEEAVESQKRGLWKPYTTDMKRTADNSTKNKVKVKQYKQQET